MLMARYFIGSTLAAILTIVSFAAFAEVNFAGKTVTILVPFKEGGGTDVYARVLVPFFAANLPGKPKVVVLNKPGGGSVRGANQFQKAKPDGLTVMGVSSSTLTNSLFGGKKVKYKVSSWVPIMLNPMGSVFYGVTDQTGVKGKNIAQDIATLRKIKSKLLMGAKNATSSEIRMAMAADMLGFFPKIVYGLSSSKWRKATLRGELNIGYSTMSTWLKKLKAWENKGKITSYMTLGILTLDGKIARDPTVNNLPSVVEAYVAANGKKPSGPQFEVFKSIVAMSTNASKSLVLPPKTPNAIRDVYIAVAKKAFADPAFSKKLRKRLGAYTPSFGSDAAKVLKAATDMTPANKKWMFDWIDRKMRKK
jgi:tripartite-type tricarboxylate transporter receptor subunit TctC